MVWHGPLWSYVALTSLAFNLGLVILGILMLVSHLRQVAASQRV